MCVRKEKGGLASKSDERKKKSVLLGENRWTANGKDSVLWSLLAKHGFFYDLQKALQYYNFMNHGNPKFRSNVNSCRAHALSGRVYPYHIVSMSSLTQCN